MRLLLQGSMAETFSMTEANQEVNTDYLISLSSILFSEEDDIVDYLEFDDSSGISF